MEQPIENINVENVKTVLQSQQVRAYIEALSMILELARDPYDETYPSEKVIEECEK